MKRSIGLILLALVFAATATQVGVALHLVMQVVQKKLIFWAEPEQVIGA